MAIFQPAWPDLERAHGPSGRTTGPRGPRHQAARVLIWSLESGGCSRREAGNLVGLARGLRPAASGWTERELEHLEFLRELVDTGRLDH